MDSIVVSDLHGNTEKYYKLFDFIEKNKPKYVFLAGDLMPFGGTISADDQPNFDDFLRTFLFTEFEKIRRKNKYKSPDIFVIFGNDDPRYFENTAIDGERAKIWHYIHNRKETINNIDFYGYSFIPPTPFMLKDWEKYDVSRFVDPGCSAPHEGTRSLYIPERDKIFSTIKTDLDNLTKNNDLNNSVFLFHSPPHKTNLDRAALDGKMIDYVPVDVHIGSIAIKNFIIKKQPKITMHGHVHESTSITGKWKEKIGATVSFQAAHNGNELSVIQFDLKNPEHSERNLI